MVLYRRKGAVSAWSRWLLDGACRPGPARIAAPAGGWRALAAAAALAVCRGRRCHAGRQAAPPSPAGPRSRALAALDSGCMRVPSAARPAAGQPAQEGDPGLLRLRVRRGPEGALLMASSFERFQAVSSGFKQCQAADVTWSTRGGGGALGEPRQQPLPALLSLTNTAVPALCFPPCCPAGQGGGGAQGEPGQVEAGAAAQGAGHAGRAPRLRRQGGPAFLLLV